MTLELRPPEAAYAEPESVVAFYRAPPREGARALPGVTRGRPRSAPAARHRDRGLGPGRRGTSRSRPAATRRATGRSPRTGHWRRSASGSPPAGHCPAPTRRPRSPWCSSTRPSSARTGRGGDPIGRRIRMGSNASRPWMTVVGVVRDERHNGLTGAIKEKFFVPYAQFPAARGGDAARNMSLVVRTSGDPAALAGPIRAAVRELDPALPIANVRRMTDVVAASMATPRLTGSLLTIFGGLALFLAAVGVSGRAVVPREPAAPRDRDPHGARRLARERPRPDRAARRRDGGLGRRGRRPRRRSS